MRSKPAAFLKSLVSASGSPWMLCNLKFSGPRHLFAFVKFSWAHHYAKVSASMRILTRLRDILTVQRKVSPCKGTIYCLFSDRKMRSLLRRAKAHQKGQTHTLVVWYDRFNCDGDLSTWGTGFKNFPTLVEFGLYSSWMQLRLFPGLHNKRASIG